MDAVHVVDAGLRSRSDREILQTAVADRRALVTADREFGNILLYPPPAHAGVVLVRIPESSGVDFRIEQVVAALDSLRGEDLAASVVIIEAGRIRVRRLKA